MSATPVYAGDEIINGKYGDLSLVRYTSTYSDPDVIQTSSYTDYYAASKVVTEANSSLSGAAKHNLTASDVEEIRKVEDFKQFAAAGSKGVWSATAGAWINAANGGIVEWDDADISVTTDAFPVVELEAAGVQLYQGQVFFKGASTKINAALKAYPSEGAAKNDHAAGALSLDNLHQDAVKNPSQRRVIFGSDETQLTATAEGENAEAYGIWAVVNDESLPVIEIGGKNASITVVSDGYANGITLERNDTYEAKNAADPVLTPDRSGFIALKSGKAVMNVTGKNAVGVRADTGIFSAKGDFELTATAKEGGSAYGAAAVGYGELYFAGPAKITAQGGTRNVALLLVKDSDVPDDFYEAEAYVNGPAQKPTAVFDGSASLKGDVHAGAGSVMKIYGDVNAVGNWHSEGLITGGSDDPKVEPTFGSLTITGDSVYLGANSGQNETVSIDGNDENVHTHVKSLTVNGKDVSVQSYIYAEDSITLSGGKIVNGTNDPNNHLGNFSSGFVTPKFVLENGAVLDNFGDLQARYIKIASGAEYHEADDEFGLTEDGKGLVFAWGDDTVELAGGRLTNIGDGSLTDEEENPIVIDRGLDLRVIALQAETTGSSVSRKDARLVVSAGDYKFDDVTLDLEKGAVEVTGGSLTAAEFNAKQGTLGISGGNFRADTFNAIGTMSANAKGGLFSVGTYEGKADSAFTLKSGEMKVSLLSLAKGAKLAVENSTLSTTTDQVFSESVMGDKGDGKNFAANGLAGLGGLTFANGSLALNDEFYNTLYAGQAEQVYKGAKLVWNGKQVDVSGPIAIEKLPESGSSIHSNIDVTVEAGEGGSVKVAKDFGASAIIVGNGTGAKATVDISKNVTLVGSAEAGKELIQGAKEVTVTGSLELGNTASSNNQGKISVAVTVEKKASFKVNDGSFHLADVTASSDGKIEVKKGDVTIGSLTIEGGRLSVGEAKVDIESLNLKGEALADLSERATTVKNMVVDAAADAVITGKVAVDKLIAAADSEGEAAVGTGATIRIGVANEAFSKRGDVKLGKDSSLAGLHFFLDPIWHEGQEITEGSRLVLEGTELDGSVTVGNNSYLVLGTDDDTGLLTLFAETNSRKLTWGTDTLAAVYAAQPISVTSGALFVDQNANDTIRGADGSVTFASKSLLVADASAAADENGAIHASGDASISDEAKAVIIGILDATTSYRLVTAGGTLDGGFGSVTAGNAMWRLNANEDGSFSATLQDAGLVYGDNMQGSELANAGMAGTGDAFDWVNDILTDESGNVNALPSVAALFDAAMNPAGALASFTTAYDRSSDLRRAVRAEAVSEEGPRLWAQLTGGKTKLKGISTGGVALHTKTDAYGVIVGAEGSLEDFTIGGAISVGTGDTKNDSVSAKDDFDWYGFSVYGRTTVGGVDVLADASATFLKSDLTVGGKAAVDTDTTTAVWSIGAQVQKTFDVGVDLTPFIGMDIYHVRADGYANGHGADVQDANATSVEFPIGATVAKTFEASCGAKIAPTFTLAVVPTVGDRDIDSKVKFAGAESTYNFTFADDVKVRANLGVNASKGGFSFGLSAGYEWGSEERSSTNLMLRTSYAF